MGEGLSANNIFICQSKSVVKHINNIYQSEELDKDAICSIVEQLARVWQNESFLGGDRIFWR